MRKLLWVLLILFSTQHLKAPIFPTSVIEENRERIIWYFKDQEFRSSEFTPEVFYEALCFIGIQNPEIVFRQSVLETGWFKSSSFRDYHNPFGMKQPTTRETLCKGTELGHGEFNHWYEAVKDYKLWQDYWLDTIYTSEEYYYFLDTLSYAEAKHYTTTLRKLKLDNLGDCPPT